MLSFIATLIIIGLINFGVTIITNFSFIEVSVFVGLASVFIIYFFSSSGGVTSRSIDMQVQGQTGIKMNQSPEKFSPSYAFYGSILYLIGSVIANFFMYKQYFL
ncbi:hypothetical protein DYI25_05895 [Mesobacillus boroniphilus]|uniref:Uncharacterized protein n=1 Tax=Mesobacillus boroniphilus TaxID=308892 RepID=A0A944GVW2_9BACI|nr:hypothetical protein [Mesobacillus boroniphilus]